MGRIRLELNKAERRFKNNFDRRLRLRCKELTPGVHALLRVENLSERPGRRHKLAPLAAGPFPVINVGDETIIMERSSEIREEVSIYCAKPAPPPLGSIQTAPERPLLEGSPNQEGRQETSDTDEVPDLYEVNSAVAHVQDTDSTAGHLLYQV